MSRTRPPQHRGRDLDTPEEVTEFVTRFYREIAQDDRFHLYFETIAHVDWHAHTLELTDFWIGLLWPPPARRQANTSKAHRCAADDWHRRVSGRRVAGDCGVAARSCPRVLPFPIGLRPRQRAESKRQPAGERPARTP